MILSSFPVDPRAKSLTAQLIISNVITSIMQVCTEADWLGERSIVAALVNMTVCFLCGGVDQGLCLPEMTGQ